MSLRLSTNLTATTSRTRWAEERSSTWLQVTVHSKTALNHLQIPQCVPTASQLCLNCEVRRIGRNCWALLRTLGHCPATALLRGNTSCKYSNTTWPQGISSRGMPITLSTIIKSGVTKCCLSSGPLASLVDPSLFSSHLAAPPSTFPFYFLTYWSPLHQRQAELLRRHPLVDPPESSPSKNILIHRGCVSLIWK